MFSRPICAFNRRCLLASFRPPRYISIDDLASAHKNPIVKKLWDDRSLMARSDSSHGVPQTTFLTKAVADSQVEVVYNFASDPLLGDQYASPWGTMRYGKLLEDLDALAGNVAFKHANDDDPLTRLPVLVTASVDRIRLRPGVSIPLNKNYILTGRVIWVGKSSMQIRMDLSDEHKQSLLTSNFTFVARDPVTGRSHQINYLKVQTDEEKRLFDNAQESNERRKRNRSAGTLGEANITDATKEALAQELLEQGRLLEDMPGLAAGDAILHRQTKHTNTFMCYPQQRNCNGRIFGGFLMRQAYEIAFSTAYKFAGAHPRFLEIGEVCFHKPVDIGDLVNLSASVMLTYTQLRPRIHVEVVASVLSPEQKSSEITNTFSFTFELRPAKGQAVPTVKRVFPSTVVCARRVVALMDQQHD